MNFKRIGLSGLMGAAIAAMQKSLIGFVIGTLIGYFLIFNWIKNEEVKG